MDAYFRKSQRLTLVLLPLALAALYHWGLASWMTLRVGFADINVFLYTLWHYLNGADLYVMREPLEVTYEAGRSVYKFPPLYAVDFLPWVEATRGINQHIYTTLFCVHVLRYVMAAVLVFWFWGPRRNLLWLSAVIMLFALPAPYYEALYGLTFDNLLLLLLVLMIICLQQQRAAGFVLAASYAAVAKIYPLLQLVQLLVERRWQWLLWSGVAVAGWLVLSLAVFGVKAHSDFYFHVLPVLLHEEVSCDIGNQSLWAQFCSPAGFYYPALMTLLKASVVIASIVVLVKVYAARLQNSKIFASFLIALTLTIMQNVWGNYQIILLIPIAIFMGSAFEATSLWRTFRVMVALLAWLPLLFSDNYPVLKLPYYHFYNEALSRFMIDHVRPYCAVVLWFAAAAVLWREAQAGALASKTAR